MTAGGQALLQSVREGREKGVGPESQDGAADTPPLGAEQAAAAGGASHWGRSKRPAAGGASRWGRSKRPAAGGLRVSQDGLDAGVLAAGTGF